MRKISIYCEQQPSHHAAETAEKWSALQKGHKGAFFFFNFLFVDKECVVQFKTATN
jgi:hypothetical protein